ncbi:hypothetical protein GCM10025870_21300 [Agromyces marinus]|uniref:Uncharacterized protein n=1 Tax=Agromyces marinus TaxID=1389020 RepID=A0ABM8H2W2_9MICO|nr:hypothetical protein [Agromyces marinus]BDZ55057.1 hypothetical protein GCM10025870_21300 [Agromyces marinus]
MSARDGGFGSGGFDDDTDWLMSQLGSGRRPDLEGRDRTEPPVAQPPVAPPAPIVPPPVGDAASEQPMQRPRRRSEESLDWFSVAEPQQLDESPTRALPIVGEPIAPSQAIPSAPPAAPLPPVGQPTWNQPDWNRPAWRACPVPSRARFPRRPASIRA